MCIPGTKYRFTEFPSNHDVLQEQRQAADIWGRKMKSEGSQCEWCKTCTAICYAQLCTYTYICSQSEKRMITKLGTLYPLNTIEAELLMHP